MLNDNAFLNQVLHSFVPAAFDCIVQGSLSILINNINLGPVRNQLLDCGNFTLANTVKYSSLSIHVNVIWIGTCLYQYLDDFIVTLTNCVKKGQLLKSVLNSRTDTLVEEKFD